MFMITALCFIVEVFISKIGTKISCKKTSISFCAERQAYHKKSTFNSYLKLRAHARENPPEDLDANLEDLGHRADSIPTQTKAEILVYGLHKSGSFVT